MFFQLIFLFREIDVLSPLFAINTQDGQIKVFFAPEQQCKNAIIEEIGGANSSIMVAIYYFTEQELADALIAATKRGVFVRVYFDQGMEKYRYSQANRLKENAIAIRFEKGPGLMHNKFIVIDEKILITGSYNFTANAEKVNDENVIILHNPEVATIYKNQFEKYWDEAIETA